MLFWPIVGDFWCPVETLVNFSSKSYKFQKIQKSKKVQTIQKMQKTSKKIQTI